MTGDGVGHGRSRGLIWTSSSANPVDSLDQYLLLPVCTALTYRSRIPLVLTGTDPHHHHAFGALACIAPRLQSTNSLASSGMDAFVSFPWWKRGEMHERWEPPSSVVGTCHRTARAEDYSTLGSGFSCKVLGKGSVGIDIPFQTVPYSVVLRRPLTR